MDRTNYLDLNATDEMSRKNFFRHLAIACDGMLAPCVYEEIFFLASTLTEKNILEIGTASGASSIAAGIGLHFSEPKGKVITIDKHTGGSRAKYFSAEESLQIVRKNIRAWNLDEIVFPVVAKSGDQINTGFNGPIDMMILDADGKINRDILQWKDYCVSDLLLVIDDCENLIRIIEDSPNHWKIDCKKYLTWKLFNLYVDAGIFSDFYFINDCVFTRAFLGKINENVNLASDKIVNDVKQLSIEINAKNTVIIPDLKIKPENYKHPLPKYFFEKFSKVNLIQPGEIARIDIREFTADNIITQKGQLRDFRRRNSKIFKGTLNSRMRRTT
ncbi:MAG: hypothetical protein EOO53_14295 [Gammaproteobacteria bacterium]|nr:MAG: hypothetical protein EOO53_14295 [Gammaproteobacteria bacterium]